MLYVVPYHACLCCTAPKIKICKHIFITRGRPHRYWGPTPCFIIFLTLHTVKLLTLVPPPLLLAHFPRDEYFNFGH